MADAARVADLTEMSTEQRRAWLALHDDYAASYEALFDEHEELFDRLGIVAGVLLAVISSTVFVVEPVFYWPGPQTIWYEGMLEPSQLAKFGKHPHDPEVDAAIVDIRNQLNDLFSELNAAARR